MSNENQFEFEIYESFRETQIVVKFQEANNSLWTMDELAKVKDAYILQSDRSKIRSICIRKDEDVYIPRKDINLPKARWLTVATSASYPNTVLIAAIQKESQLSAKEISAYSTSKNNPSSQYLEIEDGFVRIIPSGIRWVLNLLEKDSQIEGTK